MFSQRPGAGGGLFCGNLFRRLFQASDDIKMGCFAAPLPSEELKTDGTEENGEDLQQPTYRPLSDVSASSAQQAVMAVRGCLQPPEKGGRLPFRQVCDYQANLRRVLEQDAVPIREYEERLGKMSPSAAAGHHL